MDPNTAGLALLAAARAPKHVHMPGPSEGDGMHGRQGRLSAVPHRSLDFTQIRWCWFEEAWPDRVERAVDGRRLAYLGPMSLIRNKRDTGRTRDMLDVELLRKAGVDVDGAERGDIGGDGSSAPGSSSPES